MNLKRKMLELIADEVSHKVMETLSVINKVEEATVGKATIPNLSLSIR